MKIAIVGSGNGGCAMAAVLAMHGKKCLRMVDIVFVTIMSNENIAEATMLHAFLSLGGLPYE